LRCNMAQIGKPHRGSLASACRQNRGTQHVERRLDGREIKGKMRLLPYQSEKHQLAAVETLVGASLEDTGDIEPRQHDRPARAAVALGHQALVAPDGDKEATGSGTALAYPRGIAAAQAGPLKTRMGVEIGRSHSLRLAHRRASRQAAEPSQSSEAALQISAFD